MASSYFTGGPWKQILGLALAALLLVTHAVTAEGLSADGVPTDRSNDSIYPNSLCCAILARRLGSIVSTSKSTLYQSSTSSFWSLQAQNVRPGCIVSPTTTTQVSQTICVLNYLRVSGINCQFAIRSGGHTPWAGSSSIQNGVQIDLAAINQVTLASNQKTTSVGPGARWIDAYSKLDALSLTVVGGRVASVGVGGLITGGGISFFSSRYGFAADNVINFEVVLYDGSVVNANASFRQDLFYALKGGSNNFGIVTRFDLATYDSGNFWGGSLINPISTKNQSLAAFVKFTGQADYDPYSALIHAYAWSAANGGWVIASTLIYTKPVNNPAVFQDFLAIQPQLFHTMRMSNMSDFTLELATTSPASRKELFFTSTWSNDLQTLTDIEALSEEYLQTVSRVPDLVWSLCFQPLVTAITTKSAATGGNALGLDASDGNLVLGLVVATWTNTADDEAVLAAVSGFFAAADKLAASRGKLNSFKYLNYAYKTQEPIKGYGDPNLAKLRAASKKYDPAGVFQKLVPGGWKLW